METLGGIGSHGHLDGFDFINFGQPNGIPQESKLLTYLNGRGNAVEDSLAKNVANLTMDDKKFHVPSNDFVNARSTTPQATMSHSSSSPSFANFQRGFSMNGPMMRNGDHGAFPPLPSASGTFPLTLSGAASVAGRLTPSPSLTGIRSPSGLTPQHSPPASRRRSPTRGSEASAASLYQENVNGTTYFYTQPSNGSQLEEDLSGVQVQPMVNGVPPGRMAMPPGAETPGVVLPDYHVYPGQSAHISNMQPKANVPSFFMPDELRDALLRQHHLRLAHADPEIYPDLVQEVDKYHGLCPLEPLPASPHHKSIVFGCVTSLYKATNSKTGEQYSIRRVHGFRLTNNMNMKAVQAWRDLQHSNIVQFREVFTTKVFGDNSLVLVYDYHPAAETMQSRHFSGFVGSSSSSSGTNLFTGGSDAALGRPFHAQQGKGPNLRQHAGLLPESLIWNYVIQISSALRTIHAAGLAFRCLHPSKILITHKSRLRLNCVGMADLISGTENASATHAYQQEDLVALGKLILALACNTLMALQSRDSMTTSMEIVTRNYSVDLRNLIAYLLFNGSRTKAVVDIMPMIGARFYTQLDAQTMRYDVIEAELAKEVENGRLFRMIAKLCTIVDRAELNLDAAWSETGDRYMLKLFRDYVFHQITDEGQPWLDLSHVVYCLNKLEAGSREKIALMSRDEQNILVVSYAELKHCLEQSWADIEATASNVSETGALPRGGPARSDLAHSATAAAALLPQEPDPSMVDPMSVASSTSALSRSMALQSHLGVVDS